MAQVRRAYTLMEIVLVIAILIVIAALSVPILTSMFDNSRIHAARDAVRTQLTKARNRAIEERQPYRFAVKLNTGAFRIAPDTAQYWGDSPDAPHEVDNAERPPLDFEGTLPDEVYFAAPDGSQSPSTTWHTVAVFLADGTAQQDVEIGLGMRGAPPVVVRLQASTGAITTAAAAGALRAD